MTTTNGKGILPLSTSLLTTSRDVSIFPVSLRYTAPDITTPVPGAWTLFLWNLLSRPNHYIRVRIAEGVRNTPAHQPNGIGEEHTPVEPTDATDDERKVLDHIGDSLARLARNKRVNLTLEDKIAFAKLWAKEKEKKT